MDLGRWIEARNGGHNISEGIAINPAVFLALPTCPGLCPIPALSSPFHPPQFPGAEASSVAAGARPLSACCGGLDAWNAGHALQSP